MHQMHKYAQFECYAKPDRKPVQTPKCRSDVFSCSDAKLSTRTFRLYLPTAKAGWNLLAQPDLTPVVKKSGGEGEVRTR